MQSHLPSSCSSRPLCKVRLGASPARQAFFFPIPQCTPSSHCQAPALSREAPQWTLRPLSHLSFLSSPRSPQATSLSPRPVFHPAVPVGSREPSYPHSRSSCGSFLLTSPPPSLICIPSSPVPVAFCASLFTLCEGPDLKAPVLRLAVCAPAALSSQHSSPALASALTSLPGPSAVPPNSAQKPFSHPSPPTPHRS